MARIRRRRRSARSGGRVVNISSGGEPADTAGVVAFLASDDAAFVTGQVICNAGGQRGPIRAG
jgi:hypothetical protein